MSLAACLSASRAVQTAAERTYEIHGGGASLGRMASTCRASAVSSANDTHVGITATASAGLERPPVEVLVEIFYHLDMQSAFALAATNKRFADIFAMNRASIVLHIAREEFSPFDALLQVVKASPSDLAVPCHTWLNKRVRRRHVVLCPGGQLPAHCPGNTGAKRIMCADVSLDDAGDLDRLLEVCRIVRKWERVFPQHRFNASPLLTRSLSRRENFRLRRALYHWMRYAYYFHGDLPRPNLFVPSGRDVRVNQMRALSNSELSELRDLWRTVEDIVELQLCPSIDTVRINGDFELSEEDVARIAWGEQRENRVVVATMMKLAPDELLYYMENGYRYSKTRLVQAIRQRHAIFEYDTESLSHALTCVAMERWRRMMNTSPATALPVYSRAMGQSCGGILDWDDAEKEAAQERTGEMTGLGLDWRPDEAVFSRRQELPTGLLLP